MCRVCVEGRVANDNYTAIVEYRSAQARAGAAKTEARNIPAAAAECSALAVRGVQIDCPSAATTETAAAGGCHVLVVATGSATTAAAKASIACVSY